MTEDLLADMTPRTVAACHPDRVVLFGSYAYGTPHEDSDIDHIVVMKPRDAEEANHQRIIKVTDVAKIRY